MATFEKKSGNTADGKTLKDWLSGLLRIVADPFWLAEDFFWLGFAPLRKEARLVLSFLYEALVA